MLTKIQTSVQQILLFLESWYSFKATTIMKIMHINYPQMYAKYICLTSPKVRSAWLLLLLDMIIFKIPSNRLLFLAVHTRKFQSYLCCQSKNLKEIRKNDIERKKFQREYWKYSEPKKYEKYLIKERERKQRGMYLGFQIAVVRATET